LNFIAIPSCPYTPRHLRSNTPPVRLSPGGTNAQLRRILQTSAEYFLAPLPGAEAPAQANPRKRRGQARVI
jgi:hypothetical protein